MTEAFDVMPFVTAVIGSYTVTDQKRDPGCPLYARGLGTFEFTDHCADGARTNRKRLTDYMA